MLKVIYHEACLTPYFTSTAESPFRIKAIHNKLKNHYEIVTPKQARREDVLTVHSLHHLARVRAQGIDTYEAALWAVGGALCAADLAMRGEPSFAAVRPPGHHAGRERYGGFCFFNNIAVAVASLLTSGRARSAAIVDTDMHDGDGTREIFAGSPSVIVVSPRGRERESHLRLLLDEIDQLPEIDLVAVSAGFDLYVRDWGGILETSDFHLMGNAIRDAALRKASGRYFAVLEGGYFLDDLGRNALAFCRGLEGRPLGPD